MEELSLKKHSGLPEAAYEAEKEKLEQIWWFLQS